MAAMFISVNPTYGVLLYSIIHQIPSFFSWFNRYLCFVKFLTNLFQYWHLSMPPGRHFLWYNKYTQLMVC